jgi:hypothetical protein
MRRNILVELYNAALAGEHIAARIFLHATEPGRCPIEEEEAEFTEEDLNEFQTAIDFHREQLKSQSAGDSDPGTSD